MLSTLQGEEIWSLVDKMIKLRRQKIHKGDPIVDENTEASDVDSAAADTSTKDNFFQLSYN